MHASIPSSCFHSPLTTPPTFSLILQSLQTAITRGNDLSSILSTVDADNLVEKQRGAIQDCRDLHQITLSSLEKSMSRLTTAADSRKLADARSFLSAAITNKVTCSDGLNSATGPIKLSLLSSIANAYMHVSNSLSLLTKFDVRSGGGNRRRLLAFPRWLSRNSRQLLEIPGGEYHPSQVIMVAADGTGNFSTVSDIINFAPNNSLDRTIIYIKVGIYEEHVEIPRMKTNIVLLGDGMHVTTITGKKVLRMD